MIMISILRILLPGMFILSSAFCSDVFVTQNGININKSALLYCMDRNTGEFHDSSLNWKTFGIKNRSDIKDSFYKYINVVDLNSISTDLHVWYSILGLCKSFVIIHKKYRPIFEEISYERMPNKCKKLLYRNIKELKNKCSMQVAQKLSVLTAINPSWEDALSSIKEIVGKDAPLSHDYTLTKALFILHLNPEQPSIISRVFENEKCNEDVLFYAECITGALACVLKHDKKIPADFEFDLVNTSDLEWRFMKNAKKLMQAYKDNFIKEQNKMKNSNKNIIERSKKKVYNALQDEERCKLKQD